MTGEPGPSVQHLRSERHSRASAFQVVRAGAAAHGDHYSDVEQPAEGDDNFPCGGEEDVRAAARAEQVSIDRTFLLL